MFLQGLSLVSLGLCHTELCRLGNRDICVTADFGAIYCAGLWDVLDVFLLCSQALLCFNC